MGCCPYFPLVPFLPPWLVVSVVYSPSLLHRWHLPWRGPTLPNYTGHSGLWTPNSWGTVTSFLLCLKSHNPFTLYSFLSWFAFAQIATSSAVVPLTIIPHAFCAWSQKGICVFLMWPQATKQRINDHFCFINEKKSITHYINELITGPGLRKPRSLFLSHFLWLFPPSLHHSSKGIFTGLNSEPGTGDKWQVK